MSTALARYVGTRKSLSEVGVGVAIVISYVLLDWASYIHPLYGLNITPWSPAVAIGLLAVLRFGYRGALPLFAAILLAEAWVRGFEKPPAEIVTFALVLTAGYSAMGLLLRHRFSDGRIFEDREGFVFWIGVVALGAFGTSIAFVTTASLFGVIPDSGWSNALTRFWIGDVAGILVSMPLLWMLVDARGRAVLRTATLRWETVGYVALTAATTWVAFGLGAKADFKYFYVLFLPIVWAAARQGFAGAVVSAALVQAGIIVAVLSQAYKAGTVLEIQLLALALALVGFFVGLMVDEHRRTSSELRQTLRLAAAGEMAGALAHELNQPLTAISAYGRACLDLLQRGDTGTRLSDVIGRMVTESFRAAEVLRRLRDFFRTGTMRLESLSVREIVDGAVKPFEERAKQERVVMTVTEVLDRALLADRIQLEIAMRNLLSNAFDAVAARRGDARWVRVSAVSDGGQRVCIAIEDSGVGVGAADAARIFDPFYSKKSSGLGLGLAISRSIVEAHGGKLWAEAANHGIFKLLLPLDRHEVFDHG